MFITSDHDLAQETILSVTPKSAPGSLLGSFVININESLITNTSELRIWQYWNHVKHNHSDELTPYFHFIRPIFQLTANNSISLQTDDYITTFNASSLAKLRDTPSVQCTDGTQYYMIKLYIALTSDSLFHLGDHRATISASIFGPNYMYFDRVVQFRVQAGNYDRLMVMMYNIFIVECDDPSLLYDFATHECVSQCSCGHVPFRHHSTAYCEAGIDKIDENTFYFIMYVQLPFTDFSMFSQCIRSHFMLLLPLLLLTSPLTSTSVMLIVS